MNKLLSDDEICPPELVAAIANLVKTKALLQAVKAAQTQAAKTDVVPPLQLQNTPWPTWRGMVV